MSSLPIPGLTITYKKSKGRKRGRKAKKQDNEESSTSGKTVADVMKETAPSEIEQNCADEGETNATSEQVDKSSFDVTSQSAAVETVSSSLLDNHASVTTKINNLENSNTPESNNGMPPLVTCDTGKQVIDDTPRENAEVHQNNDFFPSQPEGAKRSVATPDEQEQLNATKPLNPSSSSDKNVMVENEPKPVVKSSSNTEIPQESAAGMQDTSEPCRMVESTEANNEMSSETTAGDIPAHDKENNKVQSDIDKTLPSQSNDPKRFSENAVNPPLSGQNEDRKEVGYKRDNNQEESFQHHRDGENKQQENKMDNQPDNRGHSQPDNWSNAQRHNRGRYISRGGRGNNQQNNRRGGYVQNDRNLDRSQHNYPRNGDFQRGRGRGAGSRVQGSWDNQRGRHRPSNDRQFYGRGRGGEQKNERYIPSGTSGNYQQQGYAKGHQQQNRKPDHYYDDVPAPSDVELSKEIVRIVRHGKYKWIKMDSEGYVSVDEILDDHKFKSFCGILSLDWIKRIVETNDKKRFELKEVDSKWFIKATQGHTVQVEGLQLTPITKAGDYPNVFHGTYFDAWEQIKVDGLNRMKRNHIHFAIGLPDDRDVISGMRKSSEVAIELNIGKAMKAGLKFFVSSNNVVLSEGDHKGRVHPKFFSRVVSLRPYRLIKFDVPPDFDQKPLVLKDSKDTTDPFSDVEKPSEKKRGGKEVEKSLEEPKKVEGSAKNTTQKEQPKQENKKKSQGLNPKAQAYVPPSRRPKNEQKPKLQEPEFELATASTTQETTDIQPESPSKKGKRKKQNKR